ncbi:MAG TPA: TonB-dependent receptor [Opitutaceae bacterium]|nr:TonB-dependent receptor [Opitutaceae bacterium]
MKLSPAASWTFRSVCRRRLVAFFALAVPASASAQAVLTPAQLKGLSVEQLLEQEVLSVSRRPEALGEAASNLYFLNAGAGRLTGALSLPEALRLATNLFVAQSSSHHWGVTARGFLRTNAHSSKLLVLIDGRSTYSPLFSNVFWDTTDTFLPDVEAIEVMSGPSGANWGANTVNGIINVRSKPAHDTLGSLLHVTGGSEVWQVAARQGVRFGKDGAVRFYLTRTEREPTLSPQGTEDNADGWHATMGGFRADWGAPAGGRFVLQGEGLVGSFDTRPLPRAEHDAGHAMLTWHGPERSGAHTWGRLYYDYSRRNINDALLQTTHTVDFEFQNGMELAGGQRLLWGGNFRRIRDSAEDTVGFVILPEKLWYNVLSGFAQYELPLPDDAWRATLGARVEDTGLGDVEFQPTVRLAWRGEDRTAWFSAARATRTPSRLDRGFHAPAAPPYFVTGGPDFGSEELYAFELGCRAQPRTNVSCSLTAYLHEYDSLRSVDPVPPINIENDVEGRSYGIEAQFDWQIRTGVRARFGGFWMQQETWIEPGGTDSEGAMGESSVPDHQVFARVMYDMDERTQLWLGLRRIGEVPAAANGGGVVPAYTELDAQVTWQARPGLELALVGRNLLDRSHPEIGGLNTRREIPRSIYARVRWRH